MAKVQRWVKENSVTASMILWLTGIGFIWGIKHVSEWRFKRSPEYKQLEDIKKLGAAIKLLKEDYERRGGDVTKLRDR